MDDADGLSVPVAFGEMEKRCRVSHIRRCWSLPAVTKRCGIKAVIQHHSFLFNVEEKQGETPTIHTHSTEFRSSTFLLNDPSPSRIKSPPLALSEITMADPTIFIRYPSFLTRRHQVEMRDEHILVGQGEDFGGDKAGEIEVAKGTIIGCRVQLYRKARLLR